jgi:hypothetical protein
MQLVFCWKAESDTETGHAHVCVCRWCRVPSGTCLRKCTHPR